MLAGAAARVHARRLDERVALREGDATALGLPDASADFVVAVQTYSYVPDIVAAIAEAARVLRPGGRLGVLETDWDLYVYGSPDVELMRRIFDGRWRFEHAHLPRQLNRLFADAGLTPIHAEAFPLLETSYDPDSFGAGMLALGRNAAVRRGVDRAAADAWVADVLARGAAGDWFFCLNRFMFVATKA
jgi:SAM-dependent methyltransferase